MYFAPTEPLYTWRGRYWGFIHEERIFDAKGHYVGWMEGEEAWHKDGTYFGRVENGCLARPLYCTTIFRHVPPFLTLDENPPLFKPGHRLYHFSRFGFTDPLEGQPPRKKNT